MPRTGKQSSDLGPNLRRTPYGYQAYVTVHGQTTFKRFKPTATLTEMRDWVAITRGEQLTSTSPWAPKPKGRRGQFRADARRYLDAVTAMPTYAQRRQHIEEWVAVFGDRRRQTITAADIQAQLHRWRTEPRTVTRHGRAVSCVLAAASVNKRRTALMHLYTVLDGKSAPNPVRDATKFREPTPLPRGVPYRVLERIFATMSTGKHRARALALAYTGLPPGLLRQIRASDVDWTAGTVWVPERRKGKGTPARLLPLTDQGLKAFRAMRRYDAWGSFSYARLRTMWDTARAAAGVSLPIRIYDLRHSFGTYAYSRTSDLHAVQELMGHSSPTLTARYALAAVPGRLRAAVAAISGQRKGWQEYGKIRPSKRGCSGISVDRKNTKKPA